MKHLYIHLTRLLLFICCLCSLQGFSQLAVDNTATATQLANKIVGAGVTISNVSLQSAVGGTGIFSNGNTTNVGLNEGILLTTGDANDAIGPNSSGSTTKDKEDFADDPDLDGLTPYSIRDQAILTFDFVAESDFITLQYVFGSEEYNEYVCSQFNDLFAFFVTGPNPSGGNYAAQNVAIVPSSLPVLPVSVNTINNGSAGSQGNSANCVSLAYSSLFVNNVGGATIGYDGFTVVLTAQVAIVPGETYTFKFAIADISDGLLDSGVFIKGSSFSIYNCHAGDISFASPLPTFCANDNIPDIVSVISNSLAPDDTYEFILTDNAGQILAINTTGIFDLGAVGTGTYNIYGISYDGTI
ncbi:MAG: choice-of-anchor L domain-containing protein, partial [Crocinitomicaceae bacterium]|nr:choice-of-anchor L domain-containing protein [Crocinitomicaceae bacterium]